jgi:PTH2 family peptidyl-tRNA hydrolase
LSNDILKNVLQALVSEQHGEAKRLLRVYLDMKTQRKQVIVLRKDLNMRKGKMVAQGAHASLGAVLENQKLKEDADTKAWLEGRFVKICVGVDSEEELLQIYEQANELGLNCSLIEDAGFTEFDGVPTNTAVAVGPGLPDEVDKITGNLRLL